MRFEKYLCCIVIPNMPARPISNEDSPPPLPPKDYAPPRLLQSYSEPPRHHVRFQVASCEAHHYRSPSSPSSILPTPPPRLQTARSNPEDRAQRELSQKQQAVEEEARWQARLKEEKQQSLQDYLDEERQRKAVLDAELRYAARLQRMNAEREQLEEESAKRQIEDSRRKFREKGLHIGQESQKWRLAQMSKSEAMAREKAESRKSRRTERKSRIIPASSDGSRFSGWITLQADSLNSNRRHCRLLGSVLQIFKDSKIDEALLVIPLDNAEILEPDDGCEELDGLVHAFLLKYPGHSHVIVLDSFLEKETLISAIVQCTKS